MTAREKLARVIEPEAWSNWDIYKETRGGTEYDVARRTIAQAKTDRSIKAADRLLAAFPALNDIAPNMEMRSDRIVEIEGVNYQTYYFAEKIVEGDTHDH